MPIHPLYDAPKIELTRGEFELLLLALWMAVGTAIRSENPGLAQRLLHLADRVNANNPNWLPYELEAAGEGDR